MNKFTFPKDFLFGVATAGVQNEGGDPNSNWYRWCDRGGIPNGDHCKTACDHWNRLEDDTQLLADLNCKTYRMGIEWSRIEPEKGKFNQDALNHYKREIELLIEKGIHPLVTLWHFSHPLWVEDQGGWTNKKTHEDFLSYVEWTVGQLGKLVNDWITFNEPNVYLTFGYFEGTWPPGKKGQIRSYLRAARHFIDAHHKAYELIHTIVGPQARVGVAHHLRIFDLGDARWLSRLSRFLVDRLFQDIFLEGLTTGSKLWPLGWASKGSKARRVDFIGLNYYSRDILYGTWNPGRLFARVEVKKGEATNDLGWEIYPEGLGIWVKRLWDRFGLPIFITENGTCDHKDAFRKEFTERHLVELGKAMESGCVVARYYHWTLMDNFEWAEGYEARFGLYEVDFETQQRTLRNSGRWYSELCRRHTVGKD